MFLSSLWRRDQLAVSALVLGSCLLAPLVAEAAGPSKEQCMSANEDASVLRKRGKLLAAQKSLEACNASSCPQIIRDDCSKSLQELMTALPSIRVEATEGTTPMSDVRVLVDNEPALERLDGKSISVDPGEHSLSFFAKGRPTQVQRITLKEGEKDRVISLQFGAAPISPTAAHLIIMTEPGAGIAIDGRGATLGRFDGILTPGGHDVHVTKEGKIPARFSVDMKSGETQMTVVLHEETKSHLPWIIGGAIVVGALLIGGGIAIAASQ